MKTQEQIKKEIEVLKAVRSNVRPYSIFGDDNLAALDAQVMVFENDMEDNDIYNEFDRCKYNDYILESALYARQWISDETEDDSLAESWPLIKERE